jgi:hypothetical protein
MYAALRLQCGSASSVEFNVAGAKWQQKALHDMIVRWVGVWWCSDITTEAFVTCSVKINVTLPAHQSPRRDHWLSVNFDIWNPYTLN